MNAKKGTGKGKKSKARDDSDDDDIDLGSHDTSSEDDHDNEDDSQDEADEAKIKKMDEIANDTDDDSLDERELGPGSPGRGAQETKIKDLTPEDKKIVKSVDELLDVIEPCAGKLLTIRSIIRKMPILQKKLSKAHDQVLVEQAQAQVRHKSANGARERHTPAELATRQRLEDKHDSLVRKLTHSKEELNVYARSLKADADRFLVSIHTLQGLIDNKKK